MAGPHPTTRFSGASGRRLVAVWFADIVGYSTMASEDEGVALRAVQAFQDSCLEAVDGHGGRLVKFIGDGAFAEFTSTEAAARSALDLCARYSETQPPSGAESLLRVGIHVGDVVARVDGDLYGDGINAAARLQAIARPGQVLVSGDVWRQLRSVGGFQLTRIGRRSLRGIPGAIDLYALENEEPEEQEEVRPGLMQSQGARLYLGATVVTMAGVGLAVAAGVPFWIAVAAAVGLITVMPVFWALTRGQPGRDATPAPAFADPAIPEPSTAPGSATEARARRHSRNAGTGNLPASVDFVGRESELRRFRTLLADERSRLITITGPGGIGKTSFALRVANEWGSTFRDGAVFVPLAALDTESAILPAVAERLGFQLAPGLDAQAQVVDFLRRREMLIVLDNFEQLTQHAGTLKEMMDEGPAIRVLVTSRQRLNLKSERVFDLDGLDTSASEESESFQLFVERARRASPTFELAAGDKARIAELCGRLGGVPLAIELAASWTRALSIRDIAAEVERGLSFLSSDFQDAPERHRSLKAAFESSWGMLSPEEQSAFRRVSIFDGGFDLQAAREVADVGAPLLLALVDRSLVRRADGGRYELLEVLRQFGCDRLLESEDGDRITARHCRFFLGRLARAAQGVSDQGEEGGLDQDLANTRSAWKWAENAGETELLRGALDPLFDFFLSLGRNREGLDLFEPTMAVLEGDSTVGDHGAVESLLRTLRLRAGIFRSYVGGWESSHTLLADALQAAERADDPKEIALACRHLGRMSFLHGDYEKAADYFDRSRTLYRTIGDGRGEGRALVGIGNLAYASGDFGDAGEAYKAAAALLRAANDQSALANALCNLGILAIGSGDHAEAMTWLRSGLESAELSKDPRSIVTALQNLGAAAFSTGSLEEAEAYLTRGLELCENVGFGRGIAPLCRMLGAVYSKTDRSESAPELYARGLAAAGELGETPEVLEILLEWATFTADSDPDRSGVIAAAVLNHRSADKGMQGRSEALLAKLQGGERGPTADPTPGPGVEQLVDSVLLEMRSCAREMPPPLATQIQS